MNAIALKIREQADPIPPSSDIGAGRACEAAQRACGRIAPLWPLKNFVAVNPFLGMADRRFGEVARVMAEVAGARMTMPRAFYRDAIAQGRITDRDLGQALLRKGSAAPRTLDVAALRRQLQTEDVATHAPLPTVADVAGKLTGRDWASFACERISLWAAGYFDAGQALWPA